MFNKLRNRFLILNMTILTVVMGVAFVVIYFMTYNNVQNGNEMKLNDIFQATGRVAFNSASLRSAANYVFPAEMYKNAQDRTLSSTSAVSFNIVYDKSGKVNHINSHIDMSDETYDKIAAVAWEEKEKNSTNNTLSVEGKQWMYVGSDVVSISIASDFNGTRATSTFDNPIMRSTEAYQITFLDVTDSHKTLSRLLVTLVFVGLSMIIVVFAVSLYFANRSIKPISDAWNRQKQFIADASHELKTPVAVINANADALLSNGEETVESQSKWVSYIQAETARMGKLISDLLYLAKSEDITIDAESQYLPFDISNVVNSVILSMEAVVFERGISLSHEIEQGIIIKGDCEKIKQVVMILFDNAVKYTSDDGFINISLKKMKNNNQAVFRIENSGKGISKVDLPNIFDRFYRSDKARTHTNYSGYGLGLAIAKAIMERHGGKIYAESVENEITTFTFTIGTGFTSVNWQV